MKRKFTFLIAAALMLLTMMATTGTLWGQTYTLVSSLSGIEEGTYCIAALNSDKYYTVPKTTINGQTFTCIEATYTNNVLTPASGHGEFVFTPVANVNNAYYIYNTNLEKYLVATGSKKFGYVDNTSDDYGYWTFSTVSSGGFSGAFSVQHSSKTQYMRAYNNSVRCYDGASNNGVYIFAQNATSDPTITANDVNIAYDAEEGSIAYTITNPVDGGELTASTAANWLILDDATSTAVPFICDENEGNERTATVTLTYTYNTNQTVTKDVTVTQAGNPNVVNNIADITAAGTYTVKGTVVAKSTRGFVLGDGTGYVYYYKGSAVDQNIGDIVKLSGAVSAASNYKVFQFTNTAEITTATESNYVTEDPTVLSGSDMDGVVTGSDILLSNYVQYQGTLTVNNTYYNITSIDGATTAKGSISYPTSTDFTSLNGKVVTVTGYYVGVSSNTYYNTMIGSIEEVVNDVATPTFDPVAGTYATAQEVTFECETQGVDFYYTLDGTDPDMNSAMYENPLQINSTTTIKAIAVDGNDNTSTVATATYYICSNDAPYTVSQALGFADYQYPANGIYVSGIVSTAPTAAPTNNGELTYYISVDGEATNQLQVYKGKGLNNAAFTAQNDIQVGDIVTVYGNVVIYGTTNPIKEFAQGNYLTSFERPAPPVVPTITVDPTSVEVDADEHDGTISVTYTAIETDLGVEIHWFETSTSTEPLSAAPEWIDADFSTTSIETIDYVIAANAGEARTAYFKVCGADAQTDLVYSELVTINQAAAPQNYSLTVEPFENLELITFVDDQMELEGDGNIQVTSGAQVMLSVVADDGYVIETLMVNGVDHANDIDVNNTYSFEMPSENVTISATAVEYIPPVVGNYVRINDISYLTDGSKVIIAARYDEDNTNKYYAMTNTTSGKPTGVEFTSTTANTFEVLPSDITDEEDDYYWIVGVTENGYTFTNADGQLIGYNSSTNFATGGNNTEWNIEFGTSDASAMVANYEAFTITNHNNSGRGFALNSSHNFGPYATSNYNSSEYNFYLDFFVLGAEPVVTPSISLSSYEINAPASETIEILTITPANIENFDVDNLSADYCNADGSEIEGSKPDFVEFDFSENEGYKLTCTIANNTGEARTAYFKVIYDNGGTDVVSNVVTVNQAEYVAPVASITLDSYSIEAPAAETEGNLAITLENIVITETGGGEFDMVFCDNQGTPLPDQSAKPEWFGFDFPYENDAWSVYYIIGENTTTEERTAYFKVYGLGDDGNTEAYSELVTVTQAAFVIDYATLPFEWEGGPRSEFEALTGASTYSVGDYTSETIYCMKLDATGDYIQIKTNEQPGIVTIGVKMVGGASTSHIIVKGSSDGDNFTDVEDLTISGAQNSTHTLETTNDFAATDRYVRLYFNKGSNVGVGPITIAQVDLTPSITVAPATLNLNCDGGDGELTVTHKNLADDPQLDVIFVESDGETITTCDWIQASINAAGNVAGHINENTGEARTAYLKVTGRDADNNLIKSNLVTFNQAAYTEPSIVFNTTTLDINAGGENRTMSFDYEGLGQNPTFSINFYESDGTTAATYPWITAVITPEEKVDITVSANEGAARSAYFKVSGVNGEVNALSNLVTINQAAYSQLATYTLVESIDDLTPGYHYYIAGKDGENWFAMGGQNNNNRSAVSVNVSNNQISETDNVREFVISANNDGLYTIYDELVSEKTPGYLYAPAGSSNYLRTQVTNTDNGVWTISIDDETSVVTIKANISADKYMRYNSGSTIFSCYSSNTSQKNIYLFKKDNDTNIAYYGVETTYTEPNIPAGETITVGNGSVMTVPDGFTNTDPTSLIIEDGGQLVVSNPVAATMDKTYAKPSSWGNNSKGVNGWYLISSPVGTVNTSAVANLTPANSYDLYAYNEPDMMWYNAQGTDHPFSQLVEGEGYLYSSKDGADAAYSGTVFCGSLTKTLSYEAANAEMKGWNLLGNPYSHNITWANLTPTGVNETGYYTLGFDGAWTADPSTTAEIKPMQGFLVQATSAGAKVVFNNIAASAKARSNRDFIAFTVANGQYEDVTYAMFEKGLGLNKINHRNSDIPMVYIPQNGQNYAIATMSDETQSFNLNFKAMTTGKYTLSYKADGKYDYLHVIDRITGEDVDMLLDGEYSFMASAGDNDARFIVKLRYDANGNFDSDIFAYQNGNDVIVNGEGELQMFDLTGRMVANTMVNGVQTVNVPAQGVYIFRLVGNDVKTQKIVVR